VTRWVVVVSVVVLAAVGTAVLVLTSDAPSHSSTPAVALTSSARHEYGDLTRLVGASDLVLVGRVIADEDGRTFGEPNAAAIRSHVLTLRVEQMLVGATQPIDSNAPNSDVVILVEEEYALSDGTPVRVDGMRRGRVGDRGIWFLGASRDPEFPAYALVNAQGRFLFGADGLHGGDRSDALVRSVERLDRTQLQDAILAAASSTSR